MAARKREKRIPDSILRLLTWRAGFSGASGCAGLNRCRDPHGGAGLIPRGALAPLVGRMLEACAGLVGPRPVTYLSGNGAQMSRALAGVGLEPCSSNTRKDRGWSADFFGQDRSYGQRS